MNYQMMKLGCHLLWFQKKNIDLYSMMKLGLHFWFHVYDIKNIELSKFHAATGNFQRVVCDQISHKNSTVRVLQR